jgi:hypothetical protein
MTRPQPDPITVSAIDFLLTLNAAFARVQTMIELTRIHQTGDGLSYAPLTMLPQAIDSICTLPQRPS